MNGEADIGVLLERTTRDLYLVETLYLQGRLAMAQGRLDDAIRSFRLAIKENEGLLRPTDIIATTLALAQCYERKGDTTKARDLLSRMLEGRPTDWRIKYSLARVLVGRGEYGKAIAILSDQKLPVVGVLLLARAQSGGGDLASARRTLESLRKQRPEELRVFLEIIRLESLAGQHKRTVQLCDEVLAGDLLKTEADTVAVYSMKLRALTALEKFA